MSQPRFRSVLFTGFAILALALALIGLYGVLSQTVMRRTRDIGIRMALGADRIRILRSVLGQASALTVIGIVIATVIAAIGIPLINAMLYGIAARGTGELALAAIAMLIVAIAAAWQPAWHAASIDPMTTLRKE